MTQAVPVPPKAKRRRTQAERRDESDRSLITAAIDIVADQGVSAATFETVGHRAGYSRGLAGARFGSKQGLIEAVIAYLNERSEAMFAANRLDERRGFDALLTYLELFFEDLNRSQENRAYFRLLSSALADVSALREVFAAEQALMLQRIVGLVVKGQQEGDIRPELDPQAAAQMVGTLVLGLSMQALVDPEMIVQPVAAASLLGVRLALAPVPKDRQ